MRRNVAMLVSIVVALSIVLLLAVIGLTPLGYLPPPLNTPVFCTSMPFYDPSQYVIYPTTFPQATGPKVKFAQVIDLDPTIPDDSKAALGVRRLNGDYEYALYSTEEQKDEYLKSLHVGDCWATSIPPGCLMGHFPGEPPGRKPCTVPTPKTKTK
jgi:hypothetical protein